MRLAPFSACVLACASGFAAADDAALRKLSIDRGCVRCHREAPATQGWDKLIPLTPSWRDIAQRYRSDAGAEDALTEIVFNGSGPARTDRHWKALASMPDMPPNRYELSRPEARSLVRWILTMHD